MRGASRIAIAVVLTASVYGAWFLLDARPERNTSWPLYLGLAFVAGLLGVGGEVVAGVVSGSDEVSDPLAKRAGRLFLLLVCAASLVGLLYAVLSFM